MKVEPNNHKLYFSHDEHYYCWYFITIMKNSRREVLFIHYLYTWKISKYRLLQSPSQYWIHRRTPYGKRACYASERIWLQYQSAVLLEETMALLFALFFQAIHSLSVSGIIRRNTGIIVCIIIPGHAQQYQPAVFIEETLALLFALLFQAIYSNFSLRYF